MVEHEDFDKKTQICGTCIPGLRHAEEIIKNGHQDILTFYEAIHLSHAQFLVRNCNGLPNGLCTNRPATHSETEK
jgi:hypothetical protein